MKRIITVLLALVLIFAFSLPTMAAGNSFTHIEQPDDSYVSVLSRELYSPVKNITAQSLGLE